jgi:hypothetical protein
MLARWLQRTEKRGGRGDPLDRHHEALLCDRVRSVRRQLLGIALLLERSTEPDPRAVAELHALLSDGYESPSATQPSTSPNYARCCITAQHSSQRAAAANWRVGRAQDAHHAP